MCQVGFTISRVAMESSAASRDRREADWTASQVFLTKGPSATLEFLSPDLRAQLYAYQAQVRDGPFPQDGEEDVSLISDPSLRRKQAAWKALAGMSKEEAKGQLVGLLDSVLPDWRAWCASNKHLVQPEQQGDEADRLLRAFSLRQARSRL